MKPLKSKNPDKDLLNTISYFSFFGYPPSLNEIHTFFPERIAKNKLKALLDQLVEKKRLILDPMSFRRNPPIRRMTEKSRLKEPHNTLRWISHFVRNDNLGYFNNPKPSSFQIKNFKLKINLYTLPQYTTHFKNRASRQLICQKKLIPVKCYTGILAKFPFIRMIGVTGSASMGNTKRDDDVDLFIVTRGNCLFIGRFFAILLAHILHVRKGKNSICLNLFFDENNLAIPLQKQTPYVAHEVLQMRPVVNKNNMYERFLEANTWVKQFYPNITLSIRSHSRPPNRRGNPIYNFLFFPFELLLIKIQLAIISRNKTGLIISPTQLWLFRRDFEKRMNGSRLPVRHSRAGGNPC
ncbi:hypothetical protein HZC27_05425 [Candidatus Roizmanbacteria bacterium]|nr:hypothetical protein [Candidatus Roizmanbacteria bacterium]